MCQDPMVQYIEQYVLEIILTHALRDLEEILILQFNNLYLITTSSFILKNKNSAAVHKYWLINYL